MVLGIGATDGYWNRRPLWCMGMDKQLPAGARAYLHALLQLLVELVEQRLNR